MFGLTKLCTNIQLLSKCYLYATHNTLKKSKSMKYPEFGNYKGGRAVVLGITLNNNFTDFVKCHPTNTDKKVLRLLLASSFATIFGQCKLTNIFPSFTDTSYTDRRG